MDQDDIIQSIKLVIHNLDAFKTEYDKIFHSTDSLLSNETNEESDRCQPFLNKIDAGINEAQIAIQLADYLQSLEAEKHILYRQMRHLSRENAWLREQLGSAQKKFHECQQLSESYSNEIENLKDIQPTDHTLIEKDIDSIDLESFLNDLFPFDDTDNELDHCNNFASYLDLFILPSTDQKLDII